LKSSWLELVASIVITIWLESTRFLLVHCIPNVIMWWHTIAYGMIYITPWREWKVEDGTFGHICHKPMLLLTHKCWSKLSEWCQHMWRLGVVDQKNPLEPCVGWSDLYSHSECTWLRQSMLLFILPCLGRSSKNNFTILAQDVNPCVRKASSFWKSTPIHTSSNSKYTSLDVSKMQTTFQF
jgi:hypothetical protein